MMSAVRTSLLLPALFVVGALIALVFARDVRAVDIPDECFTPSCPYEVVELTPGLDFPTAMDFLPDGRLLIAQKGGQILQWDGTTLSEWGSIPAAILNDDGERGLLGLAVDPLFESNRRVYVYYTEGTDDGAVPTVAFFRERANGEAGGRVDVLELPEQVGPTNHLAGNIHWKGNYLYVSVGDYANAANAEDSDLPMGKILKIRRSGLAAPNNPWGEGDGGWDEYVWARGLRNSFDFAFHPESGHLWATENGPNNCDEINLLERGRNYGWRGQIDPSEQTCYPGRGQAAKDNPHTDSAGVDPWDANSPIAPTGIIAYGGSLLEADWVGDLFYCSIVERKMRHASLSADLRSITGTQVIDEADCALDLIEAPNGEIWFTSTDTLYALTPS